MEPASTKGKNHGGKRPGAGRPRVAPDGEKGSHVTAQQSKKRKVAADRARGEVDYKDYKLADSAFWEYLRPPMGWKSPFSKSEQRFLRDTLLDVVKVHADAHNAIGSAPINGILDMLKDKGFDGASTTGQSRHVINGTSLQGRKEGAALPSRNSLGSSLFLATGTWEKVQRGRQALHLITERGQRLADEIRTFNEVHHVWVADPGFPKAAHEVEVLQTPPKSPWQGGHQDTRFNTLVHFDYLDDSELSEEPTSFSTFVADPATFRYREKTYDDKSLRYIQMPRPPRLSQDGSLRWGLVNHGAWPHHGPGNASEDTRVVLMYVFALDEAASRHTTSETVYSTKFLGNSSVVYM